MKKIVVLSVIGTIVFLALIVWVFMVNTLVGVLVFGLLIGGMLFLALMNDKKNKNQNNEFSNLFNVVYDYEGYDLGFSKCIIDSKLYDDITKVISNNKFDINCVSLYSKMDVNSSNDFFYEFVDEWLGKLSEAGFVYNLSTAGISISSFVDGINKMLCSNGYDVVLDKDKIVNSYNHELSLLGINRECNYDVLEANVVARELRDYGIELISLFIVDNSNIAIIKSDDVGKLKDIEKRYSGD